MLVCSCPALAREPRDRKWLVDYVTQPIPDNDRNRRYFAFINSRLEASGDAWLGLDLDWLEKGGARVTARASRPTSSAASPSAGGRRA